MARLFLIYGALAMGVLAWSDWRGVGLFDDVADRNPTRLNPGQRSTFHK